MGYFSAEPLGPSIIQRQIGSNSCLDGSSVDRAVFPDSHVSGGGSSGVVAADPWFAASLFSRSSSENMAMSDIVMVDGVARVPGEAVGDC
jgi:hypothetical protein